MKTCAIPQTDLVVSRLAYGCASLASWDDAPLSAASRADADRLIHTAHDHGITLFDHADLYAFGKSESVFGEVLKASPGLRDQIVIQSKCGQIFPDGWKPGRPIRVDLTALHITCAVEGSLQRLQTDHLDLLLLHAPSALMRPEEIARAFDHLHGSGKVRYFGVSNFAASQIALLKKAVRQPIVVNQIHLGLGHSDALTDGLEFPIELAKGASFGRYLAITGAGTLDHCRLNDIQIQAWSPVRGDLLQPKADTPANIKAAAQSLAQLAEAKRASPAAIALAWLLHHPADIVPLTGSHDPKHLIENCAADRVVLTDDEWYALFAAAADIGGRSL